MNTHDNNGRILGYFGYRKPDGPNKYEGREAVMTDWHGKFMGRARITSSWPMPNSWISDRQYQVEAVVNGVVYTGRTMGEGMAWIGKPKANQT